MINDIQEILGFLTGPRFSNGLFKASCLVTAKFLNLHFIIEVEKYVYTHLIKISCRFSGRKKVKVFLYNVRPYLIVIYYQSRRTVLFKRRFS